MWSERSKLQKTTRFLWLKSKTCITKLEVGDTAMDRGRKGLAWNGSALRGGAGGLQSRARKALGRRSVSWHRWWWHLGSFYSCSLNCVCFHEKYSALKITGMCKGKKASQVCPSNFICVFSNSSDQIMPFSNLETSKIGKRMRPSFHSDFCTYSGLYIQEQSQALPAEAGSARPHFLIRIN